MKIYGKFVIVTNAMKSTPDTKRIKLKDGKILKI